MPMSYPHTRTEKQGTGYLLPSVSKSIMFSSIACYNNLGFMMYSTMAISSFAAPPRPSPTLA